MGAGKGFFTNYPKHVFLILGNEFCERFSFYGMKAILVLFLTRALGYSDDAGTSIYHGFNMACYFMPIFGAMLADGFLGKYKTILIISIVYSIGNIVMALGAVPLDGTNFTRAIPFTGLLLIAIGTGGIKPCVSAFGADQFDDDQVRQKQTFFSMFYMAINFGSLASMVVTPLIRSNVICFDQECYALAFGVPAVLMLVAVVVFIAGTKWYKITPPGENIIGKLFGCVGTAIKGKCACGGKEEGKKDHWLEYADSKYDKRFIEDVKAVMRVLFMFLPLPVFWALFDQQGSRWILQAALMDGDFGVFVIEPDLIHVLNPLLVVAMVPLIESLLFPCLDKFNIPNSPLQRLGLGMFLAGTAFVITAFLQIDIDKTLPPALANNQARVKVINAVPCDVTGNATLVGGESTIYNFSIPYVDADQPLTEKTGEGRSRAQFFNTWNELVELAHAKERVNATYLETSKNMTLSHGSKYVSAGDRNVLVTSKAGAVYTVVLHYSSTNATESEKTSTQYTDIESNTVNILWQVPQYFVMSLGEVFFSVTGLSFAYSQAPPSMKAVLQAAWLLTNAFGNLIVMIITAVGQLPNQMAEFLLFAGLMYVTVIIFTIMSLTYTYVDDSVNQEGEEEMSSEKEGVDNLGMSPSLDELPPKYDLVTEADARDTGVTSTYM